MDNIFGNMNTDGMDSEEDRLGGGGSLPTNVYDGIIKAMFTSVSKNGAHGVNIHIDFDGFEHRETIYVTNRTGENTYQDKKDATKKHLLPGWLMVDSILLMATGIDLKSQVMEEKVFNLYDFDQKKEMPKNVPTFVDAIGKPLTVALLETIEDVNKLDEASGKYLPTGKTRRQNQIVKAFHTESKRTTSEVKAGLTDAVFYHKWVEKNAGKDAIDKTSSSSGKAGVPGQATAGAPQARAVKPTTSLFA